MRRLTSAVLALGLLMGSAFAQEKPTETAIFAGGCFWCMEPPFDKLDGVVSTTSGYAGGTLASPTYEQVSSGTTKHAEVVQVLYDPTKVGYADLLDVFWRNVDPLDGGGQFCDRGPQYRSALFPLTSQQRILAEASRARIAKTLGQPIATTIEDAPQFWEAEGYHQDYATRNPLRYTYYRFSCGRDQRLDELWAGH